MASGHEYQSMRIVATSSCPMETMSIMPPRWTNIEIWSTSLVTRETIEPRRDALSVSVDRACTWANALRRSVANPRSDARKSLTFMT